MMTDRDREQLKAWNDTVTDFPGNPSVVEIFERQALETPERIALSFQSKSMTYRELNETANRLASALRKRGVVSNSAVAVCLDRSMSMVVAFLGILKAGGVYLPVNPTHPRDRISFQVSDAGAAHVITRREMADMFEGLAVLAVDEKFEEVSGESSENPQSLPASDDQAYIIFTSGSTGTPKGVAIRHGGLANAYWAWNEVYRLRGNITAHLQMASNTFDVFVEDIVRALCSGARLVIAPGEAIISPKELYALMRAESVDSAEFVPAVIREMMRYLAETGQTLSFMRLIIVGADTWTMHEYRNAKALCGEQTRLFNSYGVTEVTIDNTYLDNPPVTLEDHRKVPIGKPFPNTRIFILDPFGNPVPVGVPGELYIGGPGVGTGYLNRPELTARHFVKLTVEGGVEEQLFRTGDLARFLSDGNIELIGRSDNQVKIRGFRIETGEIEAVLRQHPMVRQAAVQVRERSGGDRYLAAYIVPEDITLPDMALLRDYCKQKLPDYMTPPVIECLDRMPLTSSGKIDYQSLPEPAETGMVSKLSFVAPRTETEQIISRIWQEVLGMRQVGIHDTFFDLGGHSLLATQVVSRMKQALGMEITLRLFFELTTIAGIAMYVDKVKGIKEAMNSTIFSPVGNREEIEL
jgi:amino acid adenylation domain-containing protein